MLTNANWANALALNGDTLWVASGGGALAWDVEGTEVGEFLAERGITVDDVLAGLDSTRERLFQERYGDFATP